MDSFSCEECRAIAHELREGVRWTQRQQLRQGMGPQDVIAWIEELNEERCAHMRAQSPLWRTWRRLEEHRSLTGHFPPHLRVNRN